MNVITTKLIDLIDIMQINGICQSINLLNSMVVKKFYNTVLLIKNDVGGSENETQFKK